METTRIGTQEAELHTVLDGEAGRPAIVFVHGYPDCHEVWSHQMAALRDEFRVAAFDLRGTGLSAVTGRPGAYRIDRIMPDFEAVFDAVAGPGAPVHLVAHDWGSILGWSAVDHPVLSKRIASYTSIAGPHWRVALDWVFSGLGSLQPRRMLQSLDQLRRSWYVLAFQLRIPKWIFNAFPEAILRRALLANGVPKDDPLVANITAESARARLIPGMRLYQQNGFRWPPLPHAGGIAVPVQVIVPRLDPFIHPGNFEELALYTRSIEFHHLDTGHWAMRADPDAVTRLIRDFVTAHGKQ